MNIEHTTSIKKFTSSRKIVDIPIKFFFLMLFSETSPQIFAKHKGYFFISESFPLNWYIFVALINKKTVASIIMQAYTIFSISP